MYLTTTTKQTSCRRSGISSLLTALVSALLTAIATAFLGASAQAQSVLVWTTGNSIGNTTAVAAWLQASGRFSSVTGLNVDSTLPLAQLLEYDRVLYFSNTSAAVDPAGIGNVLADYADTGRRLVLSTFSWANQGGNTLAGRIIDQQLSPYVLDGSSRYTDVTLQSHDGSAYFDGVNFLNGHFHDDVALTPGATGRALWSDGESLLATKGNIVAVNLFPDDSAGNVSGDHRQLFINALATIPEPSTLLLGALAVGAVCGPRRAVGHRRR
jgi:hypothetical protein